MSMFHTRGARTRRLLDNLGRRARLAPSRRRSFDEESRARLFRPRAVVFTDTADFTTRTARDGIVHFLMIFDRAVSALQPLAARHGGDIVKVEGDSMLLRFLDVPTAARGVVEMDAALRKLNRGLPAAEQLEFSYGIGWGEILDIEDDLFGLEVNLASKLGEDMAEPGECLLTPSAAAALDEEMLKRVVPWRVVTFGPNAVPVQRLKLRSPDRARRRPVRG